jgi:tetratricopeptide (TPR) repeat protein
MKKIIVFVLFFICTLTVQAQTTDSLWAEANNLYASGNYKEAAVFYDMIEASGGASADLFYNMGNACFKQNILSKAILYYERALKLQPANPDIIHNLAMAEAMTIDKIEAVPEFFLAIWIKNIRNMAGVDTWAWLSVILFFLFLLFLWVFFFARSISLRKISFVFSILVLLLSVNSLTFASYRKAALYDNTAAIISPAVIMVKSSPDTSGKDLFILHEGTKVKILETLGEWQYIRLADGKQGWILKYALDVI